MAQVDGKSPKTALNALSPEKPGGSAEKRKLEADSDDELFFAYESSSKMKKTESAGRKAEGGVEKENKKPVVAANVLSPKPTGSPKPANKLMIQQKLFFSPTAAKASSEVKATPPPKPIVRPNGEWFIEDYLVDEQWKRWLSDEFEKPYFKEINKVLKDGYQRGIVRPPKELVFNALNSTKLDKVKHSLLKGFIL